MSERIKKFMRTLLKSLNPRHFSELSEKGIDSAIIYFLLLLVFAFGCAAFLGLPQLYFIQSDISEGLLAINTFKVSADFETVQPISIPSQEPFITLDTTNNKTIDTEFALITNDKIFYQFGGSEGEVTLSEFDFTKNRDTSGSLAMRLVLFLIPSFFTFYYLLYLIKYVVIIVLTGVLGFLIAKVFRNGIEFKESLVMAVYTSTSMVMLEVATLTLFVKPYLLTYSPFLGVGFSLIAITIYLIMYVTAIRIIGDRSLKS